MQNCTYTGGGVCRLLRAKGFTWIPRIGKVLVLVPKFDHEFVITFQRYVLSAEKKFDFNSVLFNFRSNFNAIQILIFRFSDLYALRSLASSRCYSKYISINGSEKPARRKCHKKRHWEGSAWLDY